MLTVNAYFNMSALPHPIAIASTTTRSAAVVHTLAAWDGPGFSPCAFIALPPYAGLWALMHRLREERSQAVQTKPGFVRLTQLHITSQY